MPSTSAVIAEYWRRLKFLWRSAQFEPELEEEMRGPLRTIPLGPHAVKALKEHQARVARNGDDDLVFGNRKGDPSRESKLLTNVLQPAAEATG